MIFLAAVGVVTTTALVVTLAVFSHMKTLYPPPEVEGEKAAAEGSADDVPATEHTCTAGLLTHVVGA